ncbi:MAG: hypothetical protein AB1758_03005 [Candidatus Eremiobacterota bacterium]
MMQGDVSALGKQRAPVLPASCPLRLPLPDDLPLDLLSETPLPEDLAHRIHDRRPPGFKVHPQNPRRVEATQRYLLGALKARLALELSLCNIVFVWDPGVLRERPELAQRLEDYVSGRAAASVRNLQLDGKPEHVLHRELLERGFQHTRAPLGVFTSQDPGPTYLCSDGSLTHDSHNPSIVPQDIYVHPDGGMVRVKPAGAPGNPQRPMPHLSKSVLLKPLSGSTFTLADGLDFHNEAFKLTPDGYAVPTFPTLQYGFRRPRGMSDEELLGYSDYLMSMSHRDLPS